jgi:hypothetical protein
MRQVSLLVANNKTGRQEHPAASTRQIHILTTRGDLPVEQVIYRMGSRWRQENYFRYARMHFDLDSHDAYATTDDDPTRLVPNPAKKKAHQQLLAARVRYERALAATDAALLEAVSPPPRGSVLITNADHDKLTADLRAAESNLDAAQGAHRAIPARLPLGQVNPGQQVLDIQTKLITHAMGLVIAGIETSAAVFRSLFASTRGLPTEPMRQGPLIGVTDEEVTKLVQALGTSPCDGTSREFSPAWSAVVVAAQGRWRARGAAVGGDGRHTQALGHDPRPSPRRGQPGHALRAGHGRRPAAGLPAGVGAGRGQDLRLGRPRDGQAHNALRHPQPQPRADATLKMKATSRQGCAPKSRSAGLYDPANAQLPAQQRGQVHGPLGDRDE